MNQPLSAHKNTKLLAIMMVLLAAAQAGFTQANPYYFAGIVPPDPLTIPPKIDVSLVNGTVYRTNNVSLNFFVTKPESPRAMSTALTDISFKTDWRENTTIVYARYEGAEFIGTFRYSTILTDIPDGNHSITIYAEGTGWYVSNNLYQTQFTINCTTTLLFAVETVLPKVSVSMQKSYNTADVPLDIIVNKPMSEVFYSLDGQWNVTVSGNTTLDGLGEGDHTLTVYVKDTVGFTGKSETAHFNIRLFPVLPVALPVIAAVLTVLSLLVYRRKRKHDTLNNM
jgi:hypothetical protein